MEDYCVGDYRDCGTGGEREGEHGRCGEPNSVRNGNSVVDLGEFGDERGFSDERRELSRSFFAQGGKFNEGDLVLKKISHAVKDNRGKWAPNYEGPFIVKRAFSGGALVLTNMDGEELPLPVNSDVVKRYYA